MRHLPATLSTVARTVEEILAASGPLTERRLAHALDRSDLVLGAEAEDVLAELDDSEESPTVVTLHDGRWVHLPTLVSSRPFTHRLTEDEVALDVLAVEPDLTTALFVTDDERYATFSDGTPLATAFTDLDAPAFAARGIAPGSLPDGEYVLLPPRTLAGLGGHAGGLVSLRLTPDGWVLDTVADDAVTADAARFRRRVREWFAAAEPQLLPDVVWRLCATTDAFTGPDLPVSELLDRWGVIRQGDLLARDTFDIDRWRLESRAADVAHLYRIDEEDAFAVVVLTKLVASLDAAIEAASLEEATTAPEPGPAAPAGRPTDAHLDPPQGDDAGPTEEREVAATLSASLADPLAARALLAETIVSGRVGPVALGMFVESLVDAAPEAARPALLWLTAKARERVGQLPEAEAALRRAVAEAAWPPALQDLARYESDRGHAREALDLLRRSGVDRHDTEVELLERMSTAPAHDLGRNQPCWCGSGRKYKVCHLGKEELPLAERASWLYQKAGAYVTDGPWQEALVDVAVERTRWSTSDAGMVAALQDGLVVDAVLFEGGAFRDFLEQRGALLPEDERALGEQWLGVDRSVHEVVAVRRGASLDLRDVRTGDVRTVRERTASRTLRPGTLLCARVVPAGDTVQLFGGAEVVQVHERDALVALLDSAPGAEELVAFLSRRFAPPTLRTTDDEPLVHHAATLRTTDPTGLAARLDAALGPADASPDGRSRVWVLAEDGGPVRATVELTGFTVELGTMSDERFDAAMSVLREADAALELLEHDRRTAAEVAELMARFPDLMATPSDPLADVPPEQHAEVLAAVGQLIRDHEDAWPDQALPGLGGLTPREAVADPTRRDDVVRILASWPPATSPVEMDPPRIAASLGLDLPRPR